MSAENVENFNKALNAYNRRDIEAMLEAFHPDGEWHPFTAQAEGGEAYRGHAGMRQWWANINATQETWEASADEVRDEGDVLLALGHIRVVFQSGVALDSEIGWLLRYRDGLIVWGSVYQSHAEALEAAGQSPGRSGLFGRIKEAARESILRSTSTKR